MKMRLLTTLAGLAIGFAVPVLAQEQNTADPEVRQQIEAAHMKFYEAYNKHDAAMAALWLFRRYAFGCRRILAMLDPAGMAERFNAPVLKTEKSPRQILSPSKNS